MHFPVLGVDAKLPLETLTLPQLIVAKKQTSKQNQKNNKKNLNFMIWNH